jgi:hypothetical protein
MLNKLTPRKAWTIPGTELECWVSSITLDGLEKLELTAAEVSEDMKVLDLLKVQSSQYETIVTGHFWADAECSKPLFEEGDLRSLSPAQLQMMAAELLDFSGLLGGAEAMRARFQDAARKAGGVPDPPDGEGVRGAAE